MIIQPDKNLSIIGHEPHRPLERYTPSRPQVKEPVDRRVESGGAPPTQESHARTAPAKQPGQAGTATPAVLREQQKPIPLPPLSPLMDSAALHREKFLSLLDGPDKQVWNKLYTVTQEYHPDKIDVPFPYFADQEGRIEQNELDVTVRGLKALGADAEARGVLENWMYLGERYTALPGTNQLNDLGRSGMPRLSSLLLEEDSQHQDPQFLSRAYKVIADDHQHNWSDGYFKQSKNGLNRFCDVDYSHDATLTESGGGKNAARFDGDPAPYNPIDLNAFLYRTEKDLATMAGRLAERTGDQSYSEQAESWEKKADERKQNILAKMWCPDRGLFADFVIADGSRSHVDTLAAFSVFEAGLLDPENPEEKKIADTLVGSLSKFVKADKVVWDTRADTPAPAQDLVGLARGLKQYGYQDQATLLTEHARRQPTAETTVGLATRALLDPKPKTVERGLEAWMSPGGMAQLRGLSSSFGLTTPPAVKPADAGGLDRRLHQLHSSLTDPLVINQLKARNLAEEFLGFGIDEGQVKVKTGKTQEFTPSQGKVELADASLDLGLPGFEMAKLDDNAVKVRRGGRELNIAKTETHLVLGDRAYALDDFEDLKSVKLPRDIFAAFHTAGGNPQLEQFYHANRDWLKLEVGPRSSFSEVAGKAGWNKLYEDTEKNWKGLTIEPSVVDHDTAVQYFNPAAVPSVGIFKTQFNWDTMFMAKGMQLQGQEALVSDMADNLLYLLKSTKRVPNAARSVYLNKSQPPFLPSLVRMSEPIRTRRFGEAAAQKWVQEAFEIMGDDFDNFWREDGGRNVGQINGEKVHLSRWGGPNHKFAMDESGFDTCSRFYNKTMDLVPPDLNAFLWGYAKDMEAIALRQRDRAQEEGDLQAVLKYSASGSKWGDEAAKIKADVIKYCWDDQDGMFRDYRFQGEPQGLQRDEDALSACVAPLWVGMLDPNVPAEKEMIERSLDNISRFEKDHGLAASAEDYGHPEMQWNGPSGWAPLHMMAIESEVRYGRYDAAARQTSKWLNTLDKLYQEEGLIIERYNVVKGGHPPIQKGRYEETQGEGPGFGWTNATVPWALVEVLGGVRLHRDAAAPTRMDIIPHLPAEAQAKPLKMTFADPGSAEKWQLSHHYQADENSYDFSIEGNFEEIPNVVLLTPPLPAGQTPKKGENCPPYNIRVQPAEGDKVRYEVTFKNLKGKQKLELGFGASN